MARRQLGVGLGISPLPPCGLAIVRDLFTVVPHVVELPLDADFASTAQGEVVHPLVLNTGAAHRLDGPDPFAVDRSPYRAIDLAPLRINGPFRCPWRWIKSRLEQDCMKALLWLDSRRHPAAPGQRAGLGGFAAVRAGVAADPRRGLERLGEDDQ